MDPLEDEPTPVRKSTFATALREGALTQIIHACGRLGIQLSEQAEQAIREVLDDFQALTARKSNTAIRAATEAEIEAHNERLRRESLERQLAAKADELAAARMREHALSAELQRLMQEIQK